MKRALIVVLGLALAWLNPCWAQTVSQPIPVGASYSDAQAVAAGQAAGFITTAAIPSAASAAPQAETVGGAVGSAVTYMRSDAKIPRITRATTVTTASDGTFSGTWSSSLSTAPTVILSPVWASAVSPPSCVLTSAPTATAFAGRCWASQKLPSALTLLTQLLNFDIFANPASGLTVDVIAIPPTQ